MSESSRHSILEPMPQSSELPTTSMGHQSQPVPEAPLAENPSDKPDDQSRTNEKWSPKDWNRDIFETDERKSSLTTVMKLASELNLLKEYLELYQKFNTHLGDIVSGLHHRGLLDDAFTTVGHLNNYTTRLDKLRNEKQRGTQEPSKIEEVAKAIYDRYVARGDNFWDVFEDKVNMTKIAERKPWLDRKEKALKDVVGWTLTYLEDMDAAYGVGWKEEEVETMKLAWEDRWQTYAAMSPRELKTTGWVLDA